MKATALSIEIAKSAKDALVRINAAIEAANKRAKELLADKEALSTPRIQTAIAQIQTAITAANETHQTLRRIALGCLVLGSGSTVDLTELEILALTFGLEG